MSPEKQRIAIAEKLGFENVRQNPCFEENPHDLIGDNAFCMGVKVSHATRVPDYLNDLNACHEMEKVLTPNQREEYLIKLASIIDVESHEGEPQTNDFCITCLMSASLATAAQRCEAFLKTFNLWESE